MFEKMFRFQGTWRTYQQRVLNNYEIYKNDKKFHIVAAPGSGKTTLGIELILRIDQPALILAPSITIREQWIERICEAFLIDSNHKDMYLSQDLKNPKLITVATYQAMHSAMIGYRGELVEEENEDFQTAEQVDFSGFDVLETYKNQKLGTICLDECHHLRSEWWKALEDFKKANPDLFTIALTATPPYDSDINMWKRYMNMCGEIDEEITVPELVKDGTLCPHQDYIYFNYPTKQEKESVDTFKQNSKKIVEQLMEDNGLLEAVRSHRFFTSEVTTEELLENPSYLSSMLIYLNSRNISCPKKFQKLLGYKKLETMSEKWMEILLQGFLYDDADSYTIDNVYREELIKTLKSKGMIEKRKVYLQKSKQIEKMLINSKGKCESIKTIVNHEYQNLQKDLRLLILTDYIRKEYESAIGDETKDVNNLGVLPFFELIRRSNPDIQLGVLCGTVIIIPEEAREALLGMVENPDKITFRKLGNVDDYVKVEVIGDRHYITGIVSDLFAKGYMQVLIGTKSLLGEGWDSPCINSLILASFVGSYMLSNQMRGRAIRILKEKPDKTSNIWHLVCVDIMEENHKGSEDYQTLVRRMEQFLGLHYEEDSIENGIQRFSAIKEPFTIQNVKATNKKMLQLSSERETLKNRWQSSLEVFSKMEVVDENEMDKNRITAVVLIDMVKLFFVLIVLNLGMEAISTVLLSLPKMDWSNFSIYRILGLLLIVGSIFCLGKIISLASPYRRLKLFGKGIHKALLKTNQLNSSNSRVEVLNKNEVYVIYLLGGTGHDKKIFADCVSQLYDPIDNQRYILYSKKRRNKKDGYFAVPECFSKRKEDALVFAECMKQFLGKYEAVYTRSEAGRKILLKARIKAFANKQERLISRKKVKGALE